MAFSFEVRESDLLGRVGLLTLGRNKLETPCLLPVVHPVSQAVPVEVMKGMGFKALMTNSYIAYTRRRDEAAERGIHAMLGFDGIVMTDSGGYQVLEYGDLGLGHLDIARFQARMGSDLAVTLDKPTGYPQSRGTALDTVRYSLKNAKETMEEFGGSETTWVGPVQGGLFTDLVAESASSLLKAGFGFLALGSPVQVMENYMFRDLVKMIAAARRSMAYSVPLHLFGAGHPLTMALAVAMGCDTFDSASYILFARHGRYMTSGGVLSLDTMSFLPCSCPVCTKSSVKGIKELEAKERTNALSLHNLYVLRQEVESCKEAISEGRLWDLVEERSYSHPRLRDAFSELAANSDMLIPGTPPMKERGLFVRGGEDLLRPELQTAKTRLARASRKGATKARLLSPDHGGVSSRKLREGRADLYRYHPALGAYPSELEFVYPFTQTVAWDRLSRGEDVERAASLLKKRYARVEVLGGRRPAPRNRRSRWDASPSPRSSSARSR